MAKVRKIKIACSGTGALSIDRIRDFQGSLKKRTKEDIKKISASIMKYGFSFPFFVWEKNKQNYCLDGHGRLDALIELKKDGVEIPDLPVVYVEAATEAEAKKKILLLNSQYGTMTRESVLDFLGNISMDFSEIQLPNISFEPDKIYTTKINTPVYKPSSKKPKISSLVDNEKTQALIKRIDSANISEEEKQFLRLAAFRHLLFNYSEIADYYAHSGKDIQELMEDSALVIVDINKAIESGFVELTNNIIDIERGDL